VFACLHGAEGCGPLWAWRVQAPRHALGVKEGLVVRAQMGVPLALREWMVVVKLCRGMEGREAVPRDGRSNEKGVRRMGSARAWAMCGGPTPHVQCTVCNYPPGFDLDPSGPGILRAQARREMHASSDHACPPRQALAKSGRVQDSSMCGTPPSMALRPPPFALSPPSAIPCCS
jgi:hypothetical protein